MFRLYIFQVRVYVFSFYGIKFDSRACIPVFNTTWGFFEEEKLTYSTTGNETRTEHITHLEEK
jgi:hypothetical protein